jgi:hypothetical protein
VSCQPSHDSVLKSRADSVTLGWAVQLPRGTFNAARGIYKGYGVKTAESTFQQCSGILLYMDKETKQIFQKLVDELEDIRANQGAIAATALQISLADAQDAKSLAIEMHRRHYAELRKEIEAL